MNRVVVFDADPKFGKQLLSVLASSNHRMLGVFPHSGYVDAVVDEVRPDVAFVDFTLADGDTGADTALKLAKTGCRIIICSDERRVDRKLSALSHTYIQKPVTSEALFEVLRANAA